MTGGEDPGDCLRDLSRAYKAITLVKPEQIMILARQFERCKDEDKATRQPSGHDRVEVAWLTLQVDTSALEATSKNSSASERLSEKLLRKKEATDHEIAELVDLLPPDRDRADSWTKSWCAGAFQSGKGVSLCLNTRACRNTAILCAAIVRAIFPRQVFSSVALTWYTPQRRGEQGDRDQVHGRLSYCLVDAENIRVVLSASHEPGVDLLAAEERLLLVELGFILHSEEEAAVAGCGPGARAVTSELCVVGVPSSPEDFVQRAVAACHPKELIRHNSKLVSTAVKSNFVDPPESLTRARNAFFEKWEKRAQALEPLERAANVKRPAHLRPLLENKRVLLLGEILHDLNYPDRCLARDIEWGFALHGWLPNTGVFEPCVRKPTFSLETLKLMSQGMRASVEARLVHRQASQIEESTWTETQAELQKGWMWVPGPDVDRAPKIYAMRFGLQQKQKLRVIDDCSVGGLKATIGMPEKLRVHSVDVLLNFLVHSFESTPGEMPAMIGRTFDLKSAYKQFGVDATSRDLLRILVNVPGQAQLREVGVHALPFGSVGSVGGFLRISMAVWFIGLAALRLVWSAF